MNFENQAILSLLHNPINPLSQPHHQVKNPGIFTFVSNLPSFLQEFCSNPRCGSLKPTQKQKGLSFLALLKKIFKVLYIINSRYTFIGRQ